MKVSPSKSIQRARSTLLLLEFLPDLWDLGERWGEGAPEGRGGEGPLWVGLQVQVLDGLDRSGGLYDLLASHAMW